MFQLSEVMNNVDIKQLPAVTKELFSIPGYVFLCLGSALEYFVITAAMAFFPKVIYVLFNTPLSELSWLYGTAVVLPILGGQILGNYQACYKVAPTRLIRTRHIFKMDSLSWIYL